MKRGHDQAAGLRELLSTPVCRSVSLAGGRGEAGSTTLVINLAAALAQRSRDVIVLDEFSGTGNVCNRLQVAPHHDFESVLRREASLGDALVDSGYGFSVLPIAARAQTLASLNELEQRRLAHEFEHLAQGADFLLLDTRPAANSDVPGLSLAADDVVVVLTNRAESLTDAYATIKLLHTEYGRHEFRILVNRAETLDEAAALFGRIRQVARQYLGEGIHLKLIGFVPEDEKLNRSARLGQSVLEAFPDSESAIAFRQLADAMLRWTPPRHPADTPAVFVHRLIESSRLLSEQLRH
ncbi:MinD/ParA family ATP-binding protein [Formivibrio citricus]|nr:AAA family ATPase [Formivibrio citricus]